MSSPLHEYVLRQADYHSVYERYRADEATLAQIVDRPIRPYVRIYYTDACGECARHLPALARISERLPGWTWELISEDEAQLKAAMCKLSTPIIVLSDGDGRLLGAITGNPQRGSLEADLLHILTADGEEESRALHQTTG